MFSLIASVNPCGTHKERNYIMSSSLPLWFSFLYIFCFYMQMKSEKPHEKYLLHRAKNNCLQFPWKYQNLVVCCSVVLFFLFRLFHISCMRKKRLYFYFCFCFLCFYGFGWATKSHVINIKWAKMIVVILLLLLLNVQIRCQQQFVFIDFHRQQFLTNQPVDKCFPFFPCPNGWNDNKKKCFTKVSHSIRPFYTDQYLCCYLYILFLLVNDTIFISTCHPPYRFLCICICVMWTIKSTIYWMSFVLRTKSQR